MTINGRIISALSPLSIPVAAGIYEGAADEYVTFSYESTGDTYADDVPLDERYSVMVEYFCPLIKDSVAMCDDIKRGIYSTFGEWPDMTPDIDKDGQRWIFECEIMIGVDVDG